MNSKKIIPWLIHLTIIFLILLIAFLPVISTAVAGMIANANGG